MAGLWAQAMTHTMNLKALTSLYMIIIYAND